MTAYQLRRHLTAAHDLPTRGLPYADLVAVHDDDHRIEQDHTHHDVPPPAH